MPIVIPLAELEKSDKQAIRDAAEKALRERVIALRIVTNPKDVVVREMTVGAAAVIAGAVKDFTLAGTPTTNSIEWEENSTIVTAAFTPAAILVTGSTVPDSKCVAIYGFFDKTPNPDLLQIALKRGSDTLDLYHTEHCYVYPEEVGGLTRSVTVYDQNDSIQFEMTFKTAATSAAPKFVGLYALIAEKYGVNLTAPK